MNPIGIQKQFLVNMGIQKEFNWIPIGIQYEFHVMFWIRYLLGSWWIPIRFLSGAHLVPIGSLLESYWIPIEFQKDSNCVPNEFLLSSLVFEKKLLGCFAGIILFWGSFLWTHVILAPGARKGGRELRAICHFEGIRGIRGRIPGGYILCACAVN